MAGVGVIVGLGDSRPGRRRRTRTSRRRLVLAPGEQVVHGRHQLADGDLAVAVHIEGRTRGDRAAAEREADADHELVDGDLVVAAAVADAHRRSGDGEHGAEHQYEQDAHTSQDARGARFLAATRGRNAPLSRRADRSR